MSGLLPLLTLLFDSGAVSPKAPTQVAVRQTEGSLSNLAAGLFGVGPITEIKQSFEITGLSLVNALIVVWPVASSNFLLAAPREPKKDF